MPSPAAHMLSGLFVAAIPAMHQRKYHKGYFALGAFSAAAPDLDMLLVYIGVDYFAAHRTFSHSFPFAFGIAILLWLAGFFLKWANNENHRISYTLIGSCLTCHILMDLLGVDVTGPQGLMLFWPISSQFFYPAINIFPSVFLTQGEIPSLSMIASIICQEIGLTGLMGLAIISISITLRELKGWN